MKFTINSPKDSKKITNQYVLNLGYGFGDCEDNQQSQIYIPKDSINCIYLQHGIKILYAALYSNTNYKFNHDPYSYVLGFDWISDLTQFLDPEEQYIPEITCHECQKDDHYYLDVDFPRMRRDLFYRLEGIDWKYYDSDGNIRNVQIQFSKKEIDEVCGMIEEAYKRLNAYNKKDPSTGLPLKKEYFTSDIEYFYMNKADPPEFLETSKKFWPDNKKKE